MFEERIRRNRCRRQRERKRHILLSLLSATVILGLTLLGNSFRISAQDSSAEVSYKYFTSVRIEQGDTLWTLADTYADENFKSRKDFINEVIRTNHLMDDSLKAGDYLIVPYYSSEFKQ
jgi:cell division protein YceG involved in septum cleavage